MGNETSRSAGEFNKPEFSAQLPTPTGDVYRDEMERIKSEQAFIESEAKRDPKTYSPTLVQETLKGLAEQAGTAKQIEKDRLAGERLRLSQEIRRLQDQLAELPSLSRGDTSFEEETELRASDIISSEGSEPPTDTPTLQELMAAAEKRKADKAAEPKPEKEKVFDRQVAAAYIDHLPDDLVRGAVKATQEKFGIQFGDATLGQLNEEQLTYFAQRVFLNDKIGKATLQSEKGINGFDYFFVKAFEDKNS